MFGTSAITAVTAQNTRAVTGVVTLDPAFVVAQVTAVVEDLSPAAVKTGMLAVGPTVEAVAELAARGLLPHLVVDPVLVSSTGQRLLDDAGIDAYRYAAAPAGRGGHAQPAGRRPSSPGARSPSSGQPRGHDRGRPRSSGRSAPARSS